MADVDNGALSFKAILNNDQLKGVIDETLRRIKGLSDGTVASGKSMDKTFSQTANVIRQALNKIAQACEMHEKALIDLEAQYEQLGNEAKAALLAGRDAEAKAIQETQIGIRGEITARKQALEEARKTSDQLELEAQKREAATRAAEENANTYKTLKSQIREIENEMAAMIAQGERNGLTADAVKATEAYKALMKELGRLKDINLDIKQQGKILANDEAKFQGFIQGLSGLSGAFSAATGAVSLFAGENENLQKIMTQVQSVMAIATGMQQVAQTLNKDSAFQLVTLNGLKEWWAEITGKATIAEAAETGATELNTSAKNKNAAATGKSTIAENLDTTAKAGNTVAAEMGTVANLGLAGAFRAVGAAIKSIPVFGWIITGISALMAIYSALSSSTDEAAEAQEKLGDAAKDTAKYLEEEMKTAYSAIAALKTNIAILKTFNGTKEEEKKLVEKMNNTYGETMGYYSSVAGWYDALISKSKDYCLQMELEAKQRVLTSKLEDVERKKYELTHNTDGSRKTYKRQKYKAVDDEFFDISTEKMVKSKKYVADGYVTWTGEQTKGFQNANKVGKAILKEMEENEKKAAKIAKNLRKGGGAKPPTTTPNKAPKTNLDKPKKSDKKEETFKEKLDKKKAEYERFKKWQNSVNEEIRKSAETEFAKLVKSGKTYKEFLEGLLDKISKGAQNNQTRAQLAAIKDELIELEKTSVLDSFNETLEKELGATDSVVKQLKIIKEKRLGLANDGTEVYNEKKDKLGEVEKDLLKRQEEETKQLLDDYSSFLGKKIKLDLEYNNDLALLERARAKVGTDEKRQEIDAAIAKRKARYTEDSRSLGDNDYKDLLQTYQTFEQKKEAIAESYKGKREKISEALKIFEVELEKATTEEERKELEKRIVANKEALKQIDSEEVRERLNIDFEALKASPEYIRSFEDLEFASTETLQMLIKKFEDVKNAAGENLNPQDIKEYINTIQAMVEELNARDPFGALKRGYKELKKAAKELKDAEAELNNVRNAGERGTEAEVKAIERVSKAKDALKRKNGEIRKSEKEVKKQVDDLFKAISDLGNAIGGQAGEILTLIGDIGSFVLNTIDAVKTATAAGAESISTMEKASIILAVISQAYQLATKIVAMFSEDDGTAAYEAAQKVYQSYIQTLKEVIDTELELLDTMSSKDAQDKYENAIRLINKTADAARELGRQYLSAGASSGFLGAGSKASFGTRQRKGISDKGWNEAYNVAKKHKMDWGKIKNGRMDGLFDLSAEQLRYLKEEAPLFFVELHQDVQKYINDIIAADDAAKDARKSFEEGLVGVSFDAMRDEFLSSLQDMELDAKKISANIRDYMRKALIKEVFNRLYNKKLEDYYKQFVAAMEEKSEGGSAITDKEKAALDTLRESLVKGATDAAKEINKQFDGITEEEDTSLKGAIKGVSEETASIVAGQLNAVRINQIEVAGLMRQQLSLLSSISYNTTYNRLLVDIHGELKAMNAAGGKSLRSQGL